MHQQNCSLDNNVREKHVVIILSQLQIEWACTDGVEGIGKCIIKKTK